MQYVVDFWTGRLFFNVSQANMKKRRPRRTRFQQGFTSSRKGFRPPLTEKRSQFPARKHPPILVPLPLHGTVFLPALLPEMGIIPRDICKGKELTGFYPKGFNRLSDVRLHMGTYTQQLRHNYKEVTSWQEN